MPKLKPCLSRVGGSSGHTEMCSSENQAKQRGERDGGGLEENAERRRNQKAIKTIVFAETAAVEGTDSHQYPES